MATSNGVHYRVAVIGCGSHGTRLARTIDLNPLCEVVCGVNRGQEGLDLFCERFGVHGYNDYREMLEKEQFEIGLMGLPVNVNAEIVIACAKKEGVVGIMSEKPVATSLAEADRAVEACASRGIPWASGDMFRNSPQIWKARELVEAGEIGDVQSIEVFGAGGNQMSGQGCRQLTEAFMFAGDADIEWVVGAVDGNPADAELGRSTNTATTTRASSSASSSLPTGRPLICTRILLPRTASKCTGARVFSTSVKAGWARSGTGMVLS